ncbi:hypothetical protein MKX01_003095 [Papaver californicum]|nr:hypothetical protein MKX01_003095 [Papaver californicum]
MYIHICRHTTNIWNHNYTKLLLILLNIDIICTNFFVILISFVIHIQTVRFKNELECNITIKLGYANAKIYKCEDERWPRPMCYKYGDLQGVQFSFCYSSYPIFHYVYANYNTLTCMKRRYFH